MNNHLNITATERLTEGRRLVCEATALLRTDSHAEAEALLRRSLVAFRGAMDWFEAAGDDSAFTTAHSELDAAGRKARTEFGCTILQEDGHYFETCPVTLAHVRVGLSVGMIVKRIECSICGQDVSTCPHVKGREYEGETCIHRIMDAEIREVSLVGQPAMPDARILKQSLLLTELRESLGSQFVPGMPISCDRCLTGCGGVKRPFLSH